MNFTGKVAISTGAASGMGLLFAQSFAALGGDVLLCDVNDGVLATTSQPLLRELRPIRDNLWKEQK